MPLNGWLTALFGRRNFYAACVATFTITSFLCGTATSVVQLIIYRVLQGLGGGALQPTARSILFESYPPERRGTAMAIFGLGAMVGPAIGPTLGGWIVDNYSWPLIFFINIPIGIVAFVMTMLFIRDPSYILASRSAAPIGSGSRRWPSASHRCNTCWSAANATTGSTRPRSCCSASRPSSA